METKVNAIVPDHILPVAATFLGIRGASQAGIIRTALALFSGMTPVEAAKYAMPDRVVSNGAGMISAMVPAELVPAENKSWAVRVGLGMAAGLDRAQAESWAHMAQGRPRKSTETSSDQVAS